VGGDSTLGEQPGPIPVVGDLRLDLAEPTDASPVGLPLHVPLRLQDATILQQKGRPQLPEFRFEGRYRHHYEAMDGVDFGRVHPRKVERLAAQRVLSAIAWPRWP
jgi:hypothetical protein